MLSGTVLRRWLTVYGFWILVGCGAAQTEKTVHQRLSTLVDAAERVSQQMPAQLSLAFYGDSNLVGARDAKRKAMLDKQTWSSYGHRALWVDAERDEVTPVPIAQMLPGLTDEQRSSIERVLYFRYVGPTAPDGGHISSVFNLAEASISGFQWVIDLSTRRVFSAQEFRLWVNDQNRLLSEQVVPGIEEGPGNTLMFFTRGMAKFAQPDLEMGSIKGPAAKKDFDTFQYIMARVLAGPEVRLGQSVEGYELMNCHRSPISYEKNCVRLASKRAN